MYISNKGRVKPYRDILLNTVFHNLILYSIFSSFRLYMDDIFSFRVTSTKLSAV